MDAMWVLGISLLVTLFLGIPISFSLGISVFLSLLAGGVPVAFIGQTMVTSMDSFPILAIPLFILSGAMMESGGISQRLIQFVQSFTGQIRGGLGVVTILSCAIFAAISGSSPATVAAIGTIMIPAMVKAGFRKELAASISASGGGLGIIIPPSIPMILYGISTDTSIKDLFMAGFGPALVIIIFMLLLIGWIARRENLSKSGEQLSIRNVLQTFWRAKWSLMGPVIILGGIYSGIFTPTESAAVAVVYSFVVGMWVYRELSWKKLPQILINSSITAGTVLIIICTATGFARLMTLYQIPNILGDWITSLSDNPTVLLLIIAGFLLLIGTFMETVTVILILSPILLPVLVPLGVDPVHFGMIMVIGAEIGMLTPPVGVNLFVASSISGLPMGKLSYAMIPFVICMIAAYLLIVLLPQISLLLVR
ncbi:MULTISPECIES: TRAP transporter large permease [unclassified Paenibacillus]|uniref:TRAP transporter large permease n=1 Tax=unclassified Paenibacillus TaxID=185978 RepID=UPI001AE7B048|nr:MULTISPECIES: TRAP transporter large permease [unclassified Paenibacillus]MBP1156736.1 C4-dicarboxylate transporter DctM subunit [Paenibacillus sp. PvP091]MBP1172525.1 C4-dicarboxylate transporter DctM subunit [Paenibacillus sp. PvR098]MBP2438906.1 C4-dicarboxylate transporter DctM subunit [Paenibacillus sp. PvP052]